MRLVLFAIEDSNTIAVNPDRVDAIRTFNGYTRIYAGDFYADVTDNLPTVFEKLTKDDKQNER